EDGIRDGHVTGVQTCALPILVLQYVMLAWWSPNIVTLHSLVSDIPLFKEIGLKIDFHHGVVDVGPMEFVNDPPTIIPSPLYSLRSEERRVGKECRSWRW